MLPIQLILKDRLVVVVGGGSVGLRKTRAILEAGGRFVKVVAREAQPPDLDDPRVDWICAEYNKKLLNGAELIFAAATPQVNQQVVVDANSLGIWVNSATAPDEGQFIQPSVCRIGPITIAVSTSGASPILARRIREKIAAEFDQSYAIWAELLEEIRPVILREIAKEPIRRELFESLADWPWLEQLRRDGRELTRTAMLQLVATRSAPAPVPAPAPAQ